MVMAYLLCPVILAATFMDLPKLHYCKPCLRLPVCNTNPVPQVQAHSFEAKSTWSTSGVSCTAWAEQEEGEEHSILMSSAEEQRLALPSRAAMENEGA